MPDPKHPPLGNPQTDPLLDPATLPTGLRLDPEERHAFFTHNPRARGPLPKGCLPLPPPPPPPPATLLYPFLFAVLPSWTYGLQSRGDCMAWSACHAVDLLTAADIVLKGQLEQFRALTNIEAQYGLMRVEVFGGKPDFGGDGASPTAAARSVTQFGTLHRLKYLADSFDLTAYDNSGGRSGQWGRYGLPDALEPVAAEHKCGDAILVTSFDQAVELLQSGYPISNAAPDNPIPRKRDAQGFGVDIWRASHAMNYIGYRLDPRPGLLQSNTGHGNHVTGPKWPEDMPNTLAACSAWIDRDDVEHVLRQQWSFAYSDYAGFPRRELPNGPHPVHDVLPLGR